ncbi:FtsB family cell division protein [Streptococcus sciuri]|uniref:Septum formation initiator family protein n=1 Tax=Streptococcus sciuri TaxID=2973939 RepID=A0ABT2F6B2_9STRE|nr:septum formation initiator family protein [Streptococcus sciuri]MCS4487982.1 septum formation initiator family protein [Streptococcus sciuri]
MSKENIVQLNNQYIKDEHQKIRYEEAENSKRHRLIGVVMLFMILLFILPTFNLVESYRSIQSNKKEIAKLNKKYKVLSKKTSKEQDLAKSLQDETYIEKYARAKYYLSKDGETIYLVPSLLPK